MDQLLILLLVLVVVALAVVVVDYRYFSTPARRRRALEQQARRDYAQARGTQHKRLLQEALSAHQRRRNDLSAELAKAEQQRQRLLGQRRKEYEGAVVAFLVQERLTEVKGIGPALASEIRRNVFRGRLSDLRQAQHRVRGVGPEKQSVLDAWIAYYEKQLPSLTAYDFTGKQAITNRYEAQLEQAKRAIEKLQEEIRSVDMVMAPAEEPLAQLQEITEVDFIRASSGELAIAEKLDPYLCGVFAAWEAPPAWFATLIADEAAYV